MGWLHRKRHSVFYPSPSRWSRLRTLLFLLAGEVRVVPLRMATIYKQRLDRGIDLGPLMQEGTDGTLIPCRSTHGRIADMQTLLRSDPELTVVDWYHLLAAWEMGYQFGVHQHQIQCYDIASSTLLNLESLDPQSNQSNISLGFQGS